MTSEPADLRTLYVENARVAAVFWGRRHDGVTFFVAAVAGIAASEAWLYSSHPGRLMAIPVAFAAVVGYASAVSHGRTRQILEDTYSVGAILERAILEREPSLAGERVGIFTRLHDASPYTLGPALEVVHAGVAVLALALTAAALISPPHQVRSPRPPPASAEDSAAQLSAPYVVRRLTKTIGP